MVMWQVSTSHPRHLGGVVQNEEAKMMMHEVEVAQEIGFSREAVVAKEEQMQMFHRGTEEGEVGLNVLSVGLWTCKNIAKSCLITRVSHAVDSSTRILPAVGIVTLCVIP